MVHKELYESLKKASLQESLYYTGVLLANQETEELFLTWIQIVAFLGEFSQLCFRKWEDTCKDISSVLESDELDVAMMFQITTKITILFQNAGQYISIAKKPIQLLRTNVLDIFTDKVKLSTAGKLRFMSILPKPLNEHEFCCQVLGGIISIWTKKEALRLREAFEYLCRKDYVLDSLVSETENNIISFLWDFLKVYQPDYTSHIYPLYKYRYKKKEKQARSGLLYSFHNLLYDSLSSILWSDHEKQILQQVHSMSEDLWMQVRESILDEVEKTEEPVEVDKMYYFENFYPRSTHQTPYDEDYREKERDSKTCVRSITVKNKKGSKKRESSSSKEKDQMDIYDKNYPY